MRYIALLLLQNRRRSKLYRILRYLRAKIGRYAAENGNKALLLTISILKTLNLKPFNTYILMITLNIIPAKKCSYRVLIFAYYRHYGQLWYKTVVYLHSEGARCWDTGCWPHCNLPAHHSTKLKEFHNNRIHA